MRLVVAILLILPASCVAEKVLSWDGDERIQISHERNQYWASGEAVCVMLGKTEQACGKVVEVQKDYAVAELYFHPNEIERSLDKETTELLVVELSFERSVIKPGTPVVLKGSRKPMKLQIGKEDESSVAPQEESNVQKIPIPNTIGPQSAIPLLPNAPLGLF